METTRTTDVNKMAAMTFGAVFALVGVLGFIPALSTGTPAKLLGIFEISPVHNVVHLLSGVVLLAVAFMNDGRNSRITLLVFGAVYALVALLGFVSESTVEALGVATNMADNVLHLVLAVALLGVPLMFKDTGRSTTATGTTRM